MVPADRSARFVADRSLERHGEVALGGSPLRLFRLTPAGARVLDRIVAGDEVPVSTLVERLVDAGAIHPRPGPAPYTTADVTVVVPSLGSPSPVPGALLVDDGSEPPLAGAAVRLPVNRGPAAARNAGLARVTTPLVAFVDTDVTVGAGWLDGLLGHFADPRVAVVAPRVVTPGDPTSSLDLGEHPGPVRPGSRVAYVPAAAIVCRVEALRSIGGFDETLRVGEDVDALWRLDAAGWRCRYEPTVVVEHRARPTRAGRWRQRVTYGTSAAPLAQRHPGALAPLRMSGWSVAAWLAGVLGPRRVGPVLGAAIGAGSSAALVRKLDDLPARTAFALAARGNAAAGDQIAAAVRRAWWPLVALAAVRWRWARKVLVASLLAARRPTRLVDDVAYSVGVWRGIVATREVGPLIPEIRSWPGRTTGS